MHIQQTSYTVQTKATLTDMEVNAPLRNIFNYYNLEHSGSKTVKGRKS